MLKASGNSSSRKAKITEKRVQPVENSTSEGARKQRRDQPVLYVSSLLMCCVVGIAAIWYGNTRFAPEMYDRSGPVAMAKAFAKGKNFATFDLNINIREMRDEHIARFETTPDIAVLGASHWQEAHPELLPQVNMYNAHVHRDYYEDMPAVVEMFVRHKRLPKTLIIAVRDRLFTPVADRTDFLWLPGIPYYVRMAPQLGLTPHPYWETAPVQRWRELSSASMLYSNALRWLKAPVKPHATLVDHHETLDTLRPGGSIYWSAEHAALFTRERSDRLAREFAEANYAHAPKVDPIGVETIDRLLAYLKQKGVDVYLVHPPFNPIYYDRVKGGAYYEGLESIKQLTKDLAAKYDYKVFGSFDPAEIGCSAEMYIDAEHANPECLGKLFKQFAALTGLDKSKSLPVSDGRAQTAESNHAATGAAPTMTQAGLSPTVMLTPPARSSERPAKSAERAERKIGVEPVAASQQNSPPQVVDDVSKLAFAAADVAWQERRSISLAAQIFAETQKRRLVPPLPLPAKNPARAALRNAKRKSNDNLLLHRISSRSKHLQTFFSAGQDGFGMESQ